MSDLRPDRITHQYVQTNSGSPEKVFPLLCPVREADWVPGWQYRLIYSKSGVVEADCVFATPNPDGTETVWVVTDYDPSKFRIAFVWVNPGVATAQIRIRLEPEGETRTKAGIRYTYTSLSSKGRTELERYDENWFRKKMTGWEAAINHYLRTGNRIQAAEWE
jgi:hypothetical protein